MSTARLANYTTQVPVQQTLAEIQHMLVTHGATAVLLEYDGQRSPCALNFRIPRDGSVLTFKLPCDWRAALRILKADGSISYKAKQDDGEGRAQRVAWRVCRDWLRAQLALISIGSAVLEQVMLPYIVNPKNGQTLYEQMKLTKFHGLLLPAPGAEG